MISLQAGVKFAVYDLLTSVLKHKTWGKDILWASEHTQAQHITNSENSFCKAFFDG